MSRQTAADTMKHMAQEDFSRDLANGLHRSPYGNMMYDDEYERLASAEEIRLSSLRACHADYLIPKELGWLEERGKHKRQ